MDAPPNSRPPHCRTRLTPPHAVSLGRPAGSAWASTALSRRGARLIRLRSTPSGPSPRALLDRALTIEPSQKALGLGGNRAQPGGQRRAARCAEPRPYRRSLRTVVVRRPVGAAHHDLARSAPAVEATLKCSRLQAEIAQRAGRRPVSQQGGRYRGALYRRWPVHRVSLASRAGGQFHPCVHAMACEYG